MIQSGLICVKQNDKHKTGIFPGSKVNLLFWKTNRMRLICLLEDTSVSLFLVSAPSLLDLDGKKKYIYTVEILKIVFTSFLLFSWDRQEYLLCNCQQSPSKRAPLYLACFISLNQQTSAIYPCNKSH